MKKLEERASISKNKKEIYLLYRSVSVLKEWASKALSSLLLVFASEDLENLVDESIKEIDDVNLRTENKIKIIASSQGFKVEDYELSDIEKNCRKHFP